MANKEVIERLKKEYKQKEREINERKEWLRDAERLPDSEDKEKKIKRHKKNLAELEHQLGVIKSELNELGHEPETPEQEKANKKKAERNEKIKNAAKTAAGATAGAIGAGADQAIKAAKAGGRAVGKGVNKIGGGAIGAAGFVGYGGYVFALVLIAMLVDANVTGFARDGANMTIAFLIYGALALIHWLAHIFAKHGELEEGGFQVIVKPLLIGIALMVAQVFFPHFIFKYIPELIPSATAFAMVLFITVLTAPWLIYYIFVDPVPSKLTHLAKIAWIITVIGTLLIMMLPIMFTNLKNVNLSGDMPVSPAEAFGDYIQMLRNKIDDTKIAIEESLNAQLRPENAKSQIDKNSKQRLGVFLNDLEIIQPTVISGNMVSMRGALEASALFNEMKIITSCYGEQAQNKSVRYPGQIMQSHFYILGKDKQPLYCEFPEPGFDKGRYNLYFDASFNFETWAYLDYTFVDDSTYKDYFIQGKDINSVLQIEQEPIPVFTDGPVQIFLLAISQPLRINFERLDQLPKFGVYLDKYWTRGDIEHVDEIIVQTPQIMALQNCNVVPEFFGNEHPETNESSDYFTYYKFKNPEQKAGELENIICDMNIDQDKYYQEKGSSEKLIKTIVVTADYQFSVKSSPKLLNVKENPALS